MKARFNIPFIKHIYLEKKMLTWKTNIMAHIEEVAIDPMNCL